MFKTPYLHSKYYKLGICDTERQLVTPFLCIHLHKLKFESLNWSTIGCEAAASWGWIFMKYSNITTARTRDPGHSVAPDTGERSSCQPFHLSSRRCFGLFTTQPTLHHPVVVCWWRLFWPGPRINICMAPLLLLLCSAYTPGIFKMQARVFCVARNNHEIGCHTAHCALPLGWKYLQILILTLSPRGRLPH